MANYTKTRRVTVSVKDCDCAECSDQIKKGDTIVVDPKEKKAYCYNCGKIVLKK